MKKQITISVFLLICTMLANGFTLKANATRTIALSRTQPTNIAAIPPDLSKAVLTLQDLPSGFTEMSSGLETLKTQLNKVKDFKTESVFAYQKSDSKEFQLILGFTVNIPTRIEQVGFDNGLREGKLGEEVLAGLNSRSNSRGVKFSNPTPIQLGDNIGDVSGGWTIEGEIEGTPMRVDMAAFRRGNLGAILMTFYLDGDTPSIAIADAARKLDNRMVELNPPPPTQP